MKIIALCNTYAQLLCILQLRNTLFVNDTFALILSDHSKKSNKVADRLKLENIFDDVIYWSSKEIDYSAKTRKKQISVVLRSIFGGKTCFSLDNNEYDLFLFYNYSVSVSSIFAQLYRNNMHIKCARYEEGVTSYNHEINLPNNKRMPRKLKLIESCRKIMKKKNLYDCTQNFYCYYPELYNGNLNAIKIPKVALKDNYYKSLLKRVFEINDKDLIYSKKYIYFSCVGDVEGGEPIGEVRLAKNIAQKVGYDNFMVKVHPRDDSDRYKNEGLDVDNNSIIPWEVLQLCFDFSNYLFISAISSSVLTANMILEKPTNVAFAYNLCNCDNNSVAKDAIISINNVLKICGEKTNFVSVIKSLDEIL